jgi:hypothetical protein
VDVLPKIEFGHLYKFIMSVGLVLLASSVVLPWLVLQHSDVLLIRTDEMEHLTPTARAVVVRKQRDSAWIANNYRWIAAALAVAGVLMIIYGFLNWRRRQLVLDEIEDTQLDTDKQRLRQLSPEAVVDRQGREAVEAAVEVPDVGIPTVTQSGSPDPRLARARVANARLSFAAAERWLKLRFEEAFGDTHRFFVNIELSPPAKSREVDIFAFSLRESAPSFIVELKYSSIGRVEPTRLAQAIQVAGDSAKVFAAQFGRDVQALVIFVVDGRPPAGGLRARIARIVDQLRAVIDVRFGVLILSSEILKATSSAKFKQLVLGALDGGLVVSLDESAPGESADGDDAVNGGM